jgi:hypothetical protein
MGDNLAQTFGHMKLPLTFMVWLGRFIRILFRSFAKALLCSASSTLLILGFLVASLSAEELSLEMMESPAAKRSLAPNLSPLGDRFVLSWIEREGKGKASMRIATWNAEAFDQTHTVATSTRMFANWADIPSVIEAPSGDLYAHWLEKISDKNYAYGIQLVRSSDQGKSWKSIGWLHDDLSPTEHGFVSFVPEGKLLRAFWLDGRAMTGTSGKMMLRTALIDGDTIGTERVLDDDVCTCCPVSAAALPSGPMVVHRDRSFTEMRDIAFTRRVDSKWIEPSLVQADNWFMPGCPVNGPSIATHKDLVAISRYTVIDYKGQVILSLSKNGKMEWKEIVLDKDEPIGRCTVVCTENTVLVVWISSGNNGGLELAEVTHDGQIKRRATLARIDSGRSSGMPRTVFSNGYLWVSWTSAARVSIGRVKIEE